MPAPETARQLGATHTVNIGAEISRSSSATSPARRRRRLRRHRREWGARRALRVIRPDGQVTKVGWSPDEHRRRHESARARQRPPPGVVQPQLPRLGTRHPPDRSRLTQANEIVGLKAPLAGMARSLRRDARRPRDQVGAAAGMRDDGLIIVTGGAGFIGSALVWALNQRGIEPDPRRRSSRPEREVAQPGAAARSTTTSRPTSSCRRSNAAR